MEKITVKEEVSTTKYKTIDGQVFDNMEQAIEWEKTFSCIAKSRIMSKLKSLERNKYWKLSESFGLDEYSNLYLFSPKSEADIENLLMYFEVIQFGWLVFCKDMKEKMKAGEKYIIAVDHDSGYVAVVSKNSFNNRIEKLCDLFNEAMSGAKEKEE